MFAKSEDCFEISHGWSERRRAEALLFKDKGGCDGAGMCTSASCCGVDSAVLADTKQAGTAPEPGRYHPPVPLRISRLRK